MTIQLKAPEHPHPGRTKSAVCCLSLALTFETYDIGNNKQWWTRLLSCQPAQNASQLKFRTLYTRAEIAADMSSGGRVKNNLELREADVAKGKFCKTRRFAEQLNHFLPF